jgi:hypothetical protein
MHITYHAAERFIQRVLEQTEYTKKDVYKVINYLNRVFVNIVPNSRYKKLPVPGFEKLFYAIYKENTIVTIIPKGDEI